MGNQIRYKGGERTWKGRQDGDGMLRGNGCLPAVCDQFPDRIRRPHDDYLWNHSHVQVPHSIRFVHYDHWRLLGPGCNNGILQPSTPSTATGLLSLIEMPNQVLKSRTEITATQVTDCDNRLRAVSYRPERLSFSGRHILR